MTMIHRKAYSYISKTGKHVHVKATSYEKREGPRRERSNAGRTRGPRKEYRNRYETGGNLRALFDETRRRHGKREHRKYVPSAPWF